jgi:predicted ABC-type ATPase
MPFVIMVAGPNGSGKTTLTQAMSAGGVDFGEYINADDLAKSLDGSYLERVKAAQLIADERRISALKRRLNFTFETVMSHPSKVDFFDKCLRADYKTVLYFVATSDPRLNVERVKQRVVLGGHDVPEDRIIARYHRSLVLLPPALQLARRAFVYENSDARGLRLALSKNALTQGHATYRLADDAPTWVVEAFRAALVLGPPDITTAV